MMRDPLPKDIEQVKTEPTEIQKPVELRADAANAIKYTAYIMLLFGFLYFVAAYLGPML